MTRQISGFEQLSESITVRSPHFDDELIRRLHEDAKEIQLERLWNIVSKNAV